MNILIYIWILLIILGLFIKKSKFLVLVQSLFISGMFAMNNGNPDQFKYINLYSQLKGNPAGIFSGNVGLNIIFYISSIINQYNISLFFMCLFFLFLMYKGVSFYTNNISFVFSLYLISPFVIDSIQVKNFFAMIIWLYFSKYLYLGTIGQDKKKNILMYCVGVLIASTVHYSFLFTYLYVLLAFVNKENLYKMLLSLGGVLIIVTMVMKNLTTIIDKLSKTGIAMFGILYSKIQDYKVNYDIGSADARKYVTILFYVIMLAIFIYIYITGQHKLMRQGTYYFAVGITLISVMILPLIDYSQEIYRIQRNLLILYYSVFAYNFSDKLIEHGRLKIFRMVFEIIILGMAFFYLYVESIHWNFDTGFRILFKI